MIKADIGGARQTQTVGALRGALTARDPSLPDAQVHPHPLAMDAKIVLARPLRLQVVSPLL
jgi:hypothetical protein